MVLPVSVFTKICILEPKHQVEGGQLLVIVISKHPPILELFPSKDKPRLVRQDALLVLYICLVSEDSASRMMVMPVSAFTKICISILGNCKERVSQQGIYEQKNKVRD